MTSDDLQKAAKDTTERAGKAAEEAKSSISSAAGRVGGAARDAAGRAGEVAGDFYDRAAERLPDTGEAIAAGQRAYRRGSRTIGKQIVKQPIEALLLAGAIGYLVGWATSRS